MSQDNNRVPEVRAALNTGASGYSEGLDSMARSAPASSNNSENGDDFGGTSGASGLDNLTLTSHGGGVYDSSAGDDHPVMDEHLLAAAAAAEDGAYFEQDPLQLAVQNADNNLALHDLFGELFRAPDQDGEEDIQVAPQEPMAFDLYGILRDVVGENFLMGADLAAIEFLRGQARNKIDELVNSCFQDQLNVLDETVGVNAAAQVKQHARRPLPSIVLSGAYPYIKKPTQDHLHESNLLLTLPTVYPNCQILHVDPIPYHPSLNIPKDSTPRRIFTPKNTMHWTYEPKSQQFLSNSRMVQWSDGTTTVHVGSETYAMDTFTDQGLSFIGKEQKLYRGDKTIDAVVETVALDNHVTLRPRSDFKSSVDDVISAASEMRSAQDIKLMVGMQLGGLPMTGIQGRKKTLGEEFIEKEKERLQKYAAARQREGHPLTMMEMWNQEREILEKARANADRLEELLAQQRKETEDAKRADAEAAAQRSLLRVSGGSKSLRRTIDTSFNDNDEETAAAAEDMATQNAELERTLQEGSNTNDDVTTQSPSLKKSRIEWDDTNEITTTASPNAVAAPTSTPATPTAAPTSTDSSNDESNQKRTQVLAALKACIADANNKDISVAAELLEATYSDIEGQTMVDVKAMQRKVEATISDILDDEPEFDFAALRSVL